MPEDEINEQGLYDLILSRLKEAGAEDLANQTLQVVRRGVLTQGEDEAGEGKTKALRPMQSKEALAVALEFLLTALQVPLMVNKAANTFECSRITWQFDGPPDIVEHVQSLSDAAAGLPFLDDSVERPDLMDSEDHIPLREPELPSDAEEGPSLMPIPLDFDLITFQRTLKSVVELRDELQLRFPEVV